MTLAIAGISQMISDELLASETDESQNESPRNPHKSVIKNGDILDGKYRIVRLIGQGGMGAVYEAFELTLERRVAIKVIKSTHSSSLDFQERFKREAKSMAKVDHNNVVRIHHCEVPKDGLGYIVMEYIEGETLEDLLARKGKLPCEMAVHLSQQILQALHAIHREGLIHRDLKPGNIMLTETSRGVRVRICDFGLGKMLEDSEPGMAQTELTEIGLILGTPRYMSPEQCIGDNLLEASDIYSLGIVLFEMLTGHPPFDGGSKLSVIGQHLKRQVPLERLGTNVSKSVRNVLENALKKDHKERYRNAITMIRALNEARSSAKNRSGRKIVLMAIVSVLMLAFGVGAYLAMSFSAEPVDDSGPIASTKSQGTVSTAPAAHSQVGESEPSLPEPTSAKVVDSVRSESQSSDWPKDAAHLLAQAQSFSDSGNQSLYVESLQRFLASCRGQRTKACSSANRGFARMRLRGY